MKKAWKWLPRILFAVVAIVAAWRYVYGPTIEPDSYLVLDLSGEIAEARPGGLVERTFGDERTMAGLVETLRKVRADGRIAGVIVRLGQLDVGWAQAAEIRGALGLVKALGKRVVAELELELDSATVEAWIASVADEVYVAPAAAPLLLGLEARAVFLGGVWPKADIGLQVEQIREYKTAGDTLRRETMSAAHREMLDSLLDDVESRMVRTVAEARGLGEGEVRASIRRGLSRPGELVEAGIANGVRGHGEVLAALGRDGKPAPTVRESVYDGVRAGSLGVGDGPSVAVIHASGTVHTGKSRYGGRSIGSRTLAAALRRAADDDDLAAIVLRVSSPGGSPAAADEIWLAIREAAKKKPVIASLGDVAASGAYYFASAADRIVAAPGTLTGSIGVVFYKPDLGALLGRAGVRVETIRRGRHAGLFDLHEPLDDGDLELVRTQLDEIYRLFLARVAEARGKTAREIDQVGGGRVWTGQQAFDRGLVDELGTFEDAVRAAANAAGIHDADKVRLVHFPRGDGLLERLADAGVRAGASFVEARTPAAAHVAELLGDAAAMLELEPGVQAVAEPLPTID